MELGNLNIKSFDEKMTLSQPCKCGSTSFVGKAAVNIVVCTNCHRIYLKEGE